MPDYHFPSTRPGPPVVHYAGTQPLPHPRNVPNCADIAGASPALRFMKQQQRVSSFLVNDVQTKRARAVVKDRRSPLDVDDIVNDPAGAGHVFRSTRTTNTLDPRYDWNPPAHWDQHTHGVWEIGGYNGEKPAPQMSAKCGPLRLAGKPMPGKESIPGSNPMVLHSQQLGGAARAFREGHIHNRREVRHTNHIADIHGAHADTLETAVRTNRCTNPLTPQYDWECYDPRFNMGSDR